MGIPTSVFAWSSERSPAREHLRNVLIHDQADPTRSPPSYSATATSEGTTGPTKTDEKAAADPGNTGIA